jgi:hypothetical protein
MDGQTIVEFVFDLPYNLVFSYPFECNQQMTWKLVRTRLCTIAEAKTLPISKKNEYLMEDLFDRLSNLSGSTSISHH